MLICNFDKSTYLLLNVVQNYANLEIIFRIYVSLFYANIKGEIYKTLSWKVDGRRKVFNN